MPVEKDTMHSMPVIRLVESIRKTLDKKGAAGIIFMGLSKAFDCMPHDLITKKKAYVFSLQGLRLIVNYLSDTKLPKMM